MCGDYLWLYYLGMLNDMHYQIMVVCVLFLQRELCVNYCLSSFYINMVIMGK
jgi:hypothetical protein